MDQPSMDAFAVFAQRNGLRTDKLTLNKNEKSLYAAAGMQMPAAAKADKDDAPAADAATAADSTNIQWGGGLNNTRSDEQQPAARDHAGAPTPPEPPAKVPAPPAPPAKVPQPTPDQVLKCSVKCPRTHRPPAPVLESPPPQPKEQPKEHERKPPHVPHKRKAPSPRPGPHDDDGGSHKRRAGGQRPEQLARGRGRGRAADHGGSGHGHGRGQRGPSGHHGRRGGFGGPPGGGGNGDFWVCHGVAGQRQCRPANGIPLVIGKDQRCQFCNRDSRRRRCNKKRRN